MREVTQDLLSGNDILVWERHLVSTFLLQPTPKTISVRVLLNMFSS